MVQQRIIFYDVDDIPPAYKKKKTLQLSDCLGKTDPSV